MFCKYLLCDVGRNPVAIKYNVRTNRCIVGGNPMELAVMDSIVTDYMGRQNIPRKRYVARNKVRMDFDLTNAKFASAVERMREHGLILQEVKTHGRLMR